MSWLSSWFQAETHSMLFGLLLTVVVFSFSQWLFIKARNNPFLHPMLITVTFLVGFLYLTGYSFEDYSKSTQVLVFLLGPVTVALAVPLYANIHHVRKVIVPLFVSLFAGAVVAIVSVLICGYLFGLDKLLVLSAVPKSVTTPIAMELAEKLGGSASLAVITVMATGLPTAIFASMWIRVSKIKDPRAQGFALGLAAHGIGTARAFQFSELTGSFSVLGMGLNGILTSLILPVILGLWTLL